MYLNDRGPFAGFGDDTTTTTITGTGTGTSSTTGAATTGATIGGAVGGLLNALGIGTNPNTAPVVLPASSGPDMTTLLLIGGLGLGAYMILRKKS